MSTLTFKNFRADLTHIQHTTDVSGVVDARKAMYNTTWGVDNFHRPGIISFQDALTDITGVITDAIIDGESRIENDILYTYVIGHTGKLYKIQANIPAAQVPVYDNVTLITTLVNPVAFTQGGSLNFFGDDGRIFIGHDNGVISIKTDGTDEKVVGDSWSQGMPRIGVQFKDVLYMTNGNNIGIILANGTVGSYTSLLPIPLLSLIIKDIDIGPDGTKLVIVGSTIPNTSLFASTPDLSGIYNGTSVVIQWTGNNTDVSSQIFFRSLDHTATIVVGNVIYIFGYDIAGAAVSTLSTTGIYTKILGSLFTQSPTPNVVKSNSNLVGWTVPEFSAGFMVQSTFLYGPLDREFDATWNRIAKKVAAAATSDVLRVPWERLITDFQLSGATTGYAGGVSGVARTYISTIEQNMAGVKSYKLYAYYNVPSGVAAINGVYETQGVLKDSGTYTPTATTVYFEPAIGTESFKIELIGIDGNVLAGSAHTFTPAAGDISGASGALTIAATAVIGVRVTNNAVVSPIIHKVEVTY